MGESAEEEENDKRKEAMGEANGGKSAWEEGATIGDSPSFRL